MRALNAFYVSEGGSSTIEINNTEPYIADLGVRYKGDTVGLTAEVNYNTQGTLTCAMLNQENFEKAMKILSASPFKEKTVSETYISGTVNNKDRGALILSIPYDKGWTVKIDGKKTDIIPLGDALISVPVPAGSHTVEFTFKTVGLVPGVIISLLSLLVLLAVYLRSRMMTATYSKMSDKTKSKLLKHSGFKVKTAVNNENDDIIVNDIKNNADNNK